jgi:hypothetical protein
MDLELRTQMLFGHRRALDVPARTALAPRRLPGRVLVRLVRLPEREVARVLLQVARLLGHHLVRVGPRKPTVVGEGAYAVIDVSARLIRQPAIDQLRDEGDDLRDRLGRQGLHVRPL